jgi:hypothetical protein
MPNYAMLRLGRDTGIETAIAISKLRSVDLAELGAWAKRQRKAFSLAASEEHTIFDRYHVAYTNDVLNVTTLVRQNQRTTRSCVW